MSAAIVMLAVIGLAILALSVSAALNLPGRWRCLRCRLRGRTRADCEMCEHGGGA